MQKISENHTGNISFVPGICALIGLAFLLLPDLVVGALSLVIGGLCIAFGVWKFGTFLFFSRGSHTVGKLSTLIGGAAVFFLGIYIISHAERVFSLLPIAAGIFFLLDGVDRIRSAYVMRRMKNGTADSRIRTRRFWGAALIGVLTIAIGIFLLCYPFGTVRMTVRIVGALILADAIGALWTDHALKTLFRACGGQGSTGSHGATGTHGADGKYNADFRDISDEQ